MFKSFKQTRLGNWAIFENCATSGYMLSTNQIRKQSRIRVTKLANDQFSERFVARFIDLNSAKQEKVIFCISEYYAY